MRNYGYNYKLEVALNSYINARPGKGLYSVEPNCYKDLKLTKADKNNIRDENLKRASTFNASTGYRGKILPRKSNNPDLSLGLRKDYQVLSNLNKGKFISRYV
jgi:hypothetical protein